MSAQDKSAYDEYYERGLKLLRPGGVIAVDNVLWHGKVSGERNHTHIDLQSTQVLSSKPDKSTRVICQLNEKIHADDRVDVCMLPVGDGVYLARKR